MRVREWFNGLIAECKPPDSAYSIWIEPVWWAGVCVALAMHGAQSALAVHAGGVVHHFGLRLAGVPSGDARPGGRFGPDLPWAFLACGVASAFRSMRPTSSGSYRTAVLHVSPARRAGLSARAAVSWPYLWLRLAYPQRLGRSQYAGCVQHSDALHPEGRSRLQPTTGLTTNTCRIAGFCSAHPPSCGSAVLAKRPDSPDLIRAGFNRSHPAVPHAVPAGRARMLAAFAHAMGCSFGWYL